MMYNATSTARQARVRIEPQQGRCHDVAIVNEVGGPMSRQPSQPDERTNESGRTIHLASCCDDMLFRVAGVTGRRRVRDQGVPSLQLSVARVLAERWRHLGPGNHIQIPWTWALVYFRGRLMLRRALVRLVRRLDPVPCMRQRLTKVEAEADQLVFPGPRLRAMSLLCLHSVDWEPGLQVLPEVLTSLCPTPAHSRTACAQFVVKPAHQPYRPVSHAASRDGNSNNNVTYRLTCSKGGVEPSVLRVLCCPRLPRRASALQPCPAYVWAVCGRVRPPLVLRERK